MLSPLERLSPQRHWLDDQLSSALANHLNIQLEQSPSRRCTQQLQRLHHALKHACLLGGKRVRPLLLWDVYEALLPAPLATEELQHRLLGVMLAVELIHTQSLVFDDLPCMDDDVLRRGHPTVHVAFDEATAVLVGDALACWAFAVLSEHTPLAPPHTATALLRVVQELGRTASLHGLVNGQYADMLSEAGQASIDDLTYIQRNKTGALLAFCCVAPALLLESPSEAVEALRQLGYQLGLLFQIVDDVLDATADSDQLGKTANKDATTNKATFVTCLGLEEARQRSRELSAALRLNLAQLKQPGWLKQTESLLAWVTLFEHRQY